VSDLKPVFWHQGLFLQPQHFQLTDQFHQSLLSTYQRFSQPYFWGTSNLKLVTTALEHRQCEVESGEFIFPDGTYVNLPENAVLQSRSFAESWLEVDKPFTIYLGLRKSSAFDNNVTEINDMGEASVVKTRYVTRSTPDEVKDGYADGPVASVKRLTHVLKIFWETEKDDLNEYQLIPIAQVVMDGSMIQYAPDFNPPALTLEAAPGLMAIIKEIRDELTGRALQLSSYENQNQNSTQYDATLMRYRLALRTLSRFIPKLFHLTEKGVVHPWELYGFLREMIGEISTFTDFANMLGESKSGERLLPVYDHNQLGACFSAAQYLITQMLNQISIGPRLLVEMPFDGICFAASVPPDFFKERLDFYLVLTTKQDVQECQQSLLTTGKLASRDTVEVLAERSLPGVGLIFISTPPTELPRRPDAFYIRLDIHDEQWASVERTRDIALLWEEAPEDIVIELVIVRR